MGNYKKMWNRLMREVVYKCDKYIDGNRYIDSDYAKFLQMMARIQTDVMKEQEDNK